MNERNNIDVEAAVNCTKFGPYILGESFDRNYDTNSYIFGDVHTRDFVTELSGEDAIPLREIDPKYNNERIFESEPFDYYGIEGWGAIISTHEGRIYKIGVFSQHTPSKVKLLYKGILNHFSNELKLGAPKKSLFSNKKAVWTTPYSTLKMTLRNVSSMGISQLNIVIKTNGNDVFEMMRKNDSEPVRS